jgi:hypothetical protein
MAATVIYLGDGEVGEAVVYGLPFIVGQPVTLPEGFEFEGKIVNNATFRVVSLDTPVPPVATDKPRRGRPPLAR